MEWWQTTLTVFAGIITCLTLWDKIESRVKAEKKPTNDLEARVEILERRDMEYKAILAGYEEKLQRDYDSINAIKKTMNLMLEAQWVLVDHAKNGNNTKELNDVSEKLHMVVFGEK